MATKEQERKALEKITTIIAEVGGEESYIGKAFEGCFEIAQENIDNDWWCSYKQIAESKSAEAEDLRNRFATLAKEKAAVKQELEIVDNRLSTACTARDMWEQKYSEMKCKYTEFCQSAEAENQALREQVEAAQLEIMKLKAKLYDYMIS